MHRQTQGIVKANNRANDTFDGRKFARFALGSRVCHARRRWRTLRKRHSAFYSLGEEIQACAGRARHLNYSTRKTMVDDMKLGASLVHN